MLRANSVDFKSKKDITMGYGLLEKTSEGPSLEDSLLNIRS